MGGSHSRLAPSGANIWIKCGGSVAPLGQSWGAPEEDSAAAKSGTAAHTLGEMCLKDGKNSWEYIGHCVGGIDVDAEMAARVQIRLDYVRERRAKSVSYDTEIRVDGPDFHPEFGGTIDDLVLWAHAAEIIDYKDGFIQKDPERNEQLMSYAWGVAMKYSRITDFYLTIVQPKNEASPIRTWGITRDELESWAYMELLPAMAAAGSPDAELVMGDHCRYCPRLKALQCPAHTKVVDELVETMLEADTQGISGAQLAELKEQLKAIDRFSKAVDAELNRRLLTLGQEVPGWKVVTKKADRIWKDEAELNIAALGPDAYTSPVLKSPAQIEKLPGGATLVAEWAYKPQSGYTIAPLTDSRLAVKVQSSADVFAAYKPQETD